MVSEILSNFKLLHQLNKLFEVDLLVTIRIGLRDHQIHLLIAQDLTQSLHHILQLGRRYKVVPILVKDLERVLQLLVLNVGGHLNRHPNSELRKLDSSTS